MNKWEYTVSFFIEGMDNTEHMNRMGDAGWELVGVVLNCTGNPAMFFKRPKMLEAAE